MTHERRAGSAASRPSDVFVFSAGHGPFRRMSWLGCVLVCWAIFPGTIRADVDEPVCPIVPECPAEGSCSSGLFPGVLNQICSVAFGGACIERCGCCVAEDTELFAGVTFGPPVDSPPDWPGLGGRGLLEAETALCLLRDLGEANGGSGVFTKSEIDVGPLGTASIEQRVGLVDFDPLARTMEGFHAASICAPPFGCVDDQVQSFTAALVHSSASGFSCGDYPFSESYGLDIDASDTEHRLRLELQPIEVFTPYGKISARPIFRYQTALKTGFPVGVNDLLLSRTPCPDLGTGISSVVGLADGAHGTALLCSAMPPPPPLVQVPGPGFGVLSQLGLGGRGVAADEMLHMSSPRPDLNLLLPRTADERKAVGDVAADVKFEYSFADLLPDEFRKPPFVLEANAFVTPNLEAGFASQFQVHFTDALYRSIALGPDCDVDLLGDTRVVMQSQTRASVAFDIDAGLNLVLKLTGVSTPFGDITVTVLDKHPRFQILPEPIGGGDDDFWPDAVATFQHSPAPAFSSLTSFSSTGAPIADPAAFLNECFQTPPPPGETPPTPSFTPDDPRKFTSVLEFPCNVCFAGGALSQGCGPTQSCALNSSCCSADGKCGREYDCDIDEAGACVDPSGAGNCEFHSISPSDLPANVTNTIGVFFPASQDGVDEWFCDSVEKSGCMDLCTYDPTAAQPLQVVQSAVDLDPERCGGGTTGGQACTSDMQCDDHNPCTADDCVFGGEFGTCSYSPQDGPCDDGLYCNGTDRCALGACSVHDANPCVAAGGCCEESTDTCVPECPVPLPRCGNGVLQSGEQCDDGNAAGGDGCSVTCEIERETTDCGDAAASVTELWPPNHQFVDVSIVGVTDPNGGLVSITITGITQDEPLNGPGDGDTCPDATGVGTGTARLRAERAGPPAVPGDGRVYHVSFTAGSDAGGQCSGTVTVCVPHDQRPGHVCGDQGALVDSTGPCP